MREAFDENRIADAVDPVEGGGSVDFDWEELCERIGEAESTDENREKLGQAIKGVVIWLLSDIDRNPEHAQKIISSRAIALGLEFFPEALERSRQARALATAYGLREDNISRYRAKVEARLKPIAKPENN